MRFEERVIERVVEPVNELLPHLGKHIVFGAFHGRLRAHVPVTARLKTGFWLHHTNMRHCDETGRIQSRSSPVGYRD